MPEREVLEVDVLIVGGGPAGLACAIRLHDQMAAACEKPNILVIEKGINVGAHSLSGAVLDPRSLNELIPDWKERGAPVAQTVTGEEIWLLSPHKKLSLPKMLIPPYLHNMGNYIVSVGELSGWLATQARERGIEILEGVAGAELVMDGDAVLGVRCNDTGVNKDGTPSDAYLPGAELRAKVTVLGEGVRGSLTKQLVRTNGLQADRHPQTYAVGVKEIWEIPAGRFPAGKVVHTLGYPLQSGMLGEASDSFGGSFIYGLDETHLIVGLVVGLDYHDPSLDPHHEFNRFKNHPRVRALLADGKISAYGAKAIPEGGYHAMPRMYGPGFCIIGDSASFLNAARLKGVHLAMKSGMLAAEAIANALAVGVFDAEQLRCYEDLFEKSWAREELYAVRNWRAAYAQGILGGGVQDIIQRMTHGKGLGGPLRVKADHQNTVPLESLHPRTAEHPEGDGIVRLVPDSLVTFDKVSDVYHSGTNHEENQPCHLKVPDLNLCVERCHEEFGNPCQHFCPAAVYEWIKPAALEEGADPRGRLQINPGNCVHCKTCDIKDPYENILWMVPEGGGGPRYRRM